MNKAYLLTGGNLGNRSANLQHAFNLIEQTGGILVACSHIYETAAWGITDQQAFLNQVLLLKTELNPHDLLKTLLAIETQMGRKRLVKFGPRIIDIDVLFYNNEIIHSENLIVPHPEIQNRRFVLVPLNEIASTFIHPLLKKTIAELLEVCNDPLEVKLYEA